MEIEARMFSCNKETYKQFYKKAIVMAYQKDHININENDIVDIDREIENSINFIDNNNYKYVNIHHYYYKGILKKYINTSDLDLINILKGKYKYKVLNEKLPMYHFIID